MQLRIKLLRHSPYADVSGAALSHAAAKASALAQDKITLRKMLKTTKTLLKQLMNKMNEKMGRLAPVNRPHTKTQRTATIFHSPRTRRALALRISSCLRNLLSRSASSAS